MSEFILHLSNEKIEHELDEDEPSSASCFDAIINPSLDLSFLTFLRSNDVELSLINFKISSAALTFRRNENIDIKLDIPTTLHDANWSYTSMAIARHNLQPMKIPISDFMTSNKMEALDYVNKLFNGKINTFLLVRYVTMVTDEEKLFQSHAFETASEDTPFFSSHELNLMRRYLDCAIFTRIAIVSSVLNALHPERNVGDVIDTDVSYATRSYTTAEEERIIATSSIFNRKQNRSHVRTRSVDLDELLNVPLTGKGGEAERVDVIRNIRSRTTEYLRVLQLLPDAETSTFENQAVLEKILHAHVHHIHLARKAVEIVTLEIQRQSSKKKLSTTFTPDFIEVKVDQSRQKCQFLINHDRLAAGSQLSCHFPPFMSYRLGATKQPLTGQFENIQIGPIGEMANERKKSTPRISNTITHGFQRLGNSLRIQPKLICFATDLLARNGRLQELDAIFSVKNDFVTFYTQKCVPSDSDMNFLCKNDHSNAASFKIDRARSIVNGFKILIQDENREKIYFPRDSTCQISIGFRSSPIAD